MIMVVVDRLFKYDPFILVSHPYTTSKIVRIFVAIVFKLHGMPSSIVTNRDPPFVSTFWKDSSLSFKEQS